MKRRFTGQLAPAVYIIDMYMILWEIPHQLPGIWLFCGRTRQLDSYLGCCDRHLSGMNQFIDVILWRGIIKLAGICTEYQGEASVMKMFLALLQTVDVEGTDALPLRLDHGPLLEARTCHCKWRD